MKEIGTFKIDKNMCSNCSEDENCPQKYSVNGNCLHIEKDLVIEQVPKNFAELKTLFLDKLKELNVMWFGDRFVENKSEEFWVKGILFKTDKTLSIRDNNDNIRVIMTNIDYPLMWLLIQTTLNIKSNHL